MSRCHMKQVVLLKTNKETMNFTYIGDDKQYVEHQNRNTLNTKISQSRLVYHLNKVSA